MGDALFFEYTSVCLANWLAARPYVARPDTTTVFCSIGGKSAGAPLTRFGIRMILESIARKAGVDHVTPHSLRRTFATLAIEKGAPTILVKEAGRWKSEKMVGLYARRVKPEKIRPYSPVDNIMGINPANPQDSD